ncbi:hypothetical protein [Marinococcus halophilus]|uniref:hypothetical protein n=1 Tax=Marinococcus halophilus TaxID=1371 RepID=UPI0009A70DB7|nr:hypothetical protein [Marinococcus halophilus]
MKYDLAREMAKHYQKLYIIENYIREEKQKNLYFHEYISLLNEIEFSKDFKQKLYKLVKVRNKICHMEILDIEEKKLLDLCYKEITKKEQKSNKTYTI